MNIEYFDKIKLYELFIVSYFILWAMFLNVFVPTHDTIFILISQFDETCNTFLLQSGVAWAGWHNINQANRIILTQFVGLMSLEFFYANKFAQCHSEFNLLCQLFMQFKK